MENANITAMFNEQDRQTDRKRGRWKKQHIVIFSVNYLPNGNSKRKQKKNKRQKKRRKY